MSAKKLRKTKSFSISFPPELHARLKRAADSENRNVSNYLQCLLERHFTAAAPSDPAEVAARTAAADSARKGRRGKS
jgi:hypothetical protein